MICLRLNTLGSSCKPLSDEFDRVGVSAAFVQCAAKVMVEGADVAVAEAADLFSSELSERKARVEFLAFCDQTRARYPAHVRLAFVLDNFSVHKGDEMRAWAADNNVELAYTPQYASWLNRIEPQFKGLRYFCLDGTDHPDHATQARLVRRYIAWRNHNADDTKLRAVVSTANVA